MFKGFKVVELHNSGFRVLCTIETIELRGRFKAKGLQFTAYGLAVDLEDPGHIIKRDAFAKKLTDDLVDLSFLLSAPGAEGGRAYRDEAGAALIALDAVAVAGAKIKPEAAKT